MHKKDFYSLSLVVVIAIYVDFSYHCCQVGFYQPNLLIQAGLDNIPDFGCFTAIPNFKWFNELQNILGKKGYLIFTI